MAMPAQCHCCAKPLAALEDANVAASNDDAFRVWQQRMRVCGEKGARSQQTSNRPNKRVQAWCSAGDTRACTGPNAPEKDQRPKIIGWGDSGANRPEGGQLMNVGGAAEETSEDAHWKGVHAP